METGPDYSRCRNLLWEISLRDRRPVPGRYCVNRLGVVSALDCPVFQGLSCCLYEPRGDEEAPKIPSEEEREAVRDRLVEDHLRWPYWRRVQVLRGAVAPPPPGPPPPPDPEDMDREEDDLAEVAAAPLPVMEPEAPPEKYPGQRRSEDRHRSRHGAQDEEGGEAETEDGGPEEEAAAEAPVEPPPPPAPASEGPAPASDTPAPPADVPAPPAGPPRERHRGRRRRRRRGGDRPPAPGGAPAPKEE